jgi:hypothetical protein
MLSRLSTSLILACLLACRTAAVSSDESQAINADSARLAWSALECSEYARMMGDKTQEERLMKVGLAAGRSFIDAVRANRISKDDVYSKVPMAVMAIVTGPSTEFSLGRLYQSAITDASDRIVKNDYSNMPMPIDKWIVDPEVLKIKAGGQFSAKNCSLLK